LIDEIAYVVVAELLRLQKLVQVGFHQLLYDVSGNPVLRQLTAFELHMPVAIDVRIHVFKVVVAVRLYHVANVDNLRQQQYRKRLISPPFFQHWARLVAQGHTFS
jgi:hypothetical protein